MPTAPIFIQAERVSREYRLGESVIRAVDAVSLSVEKGEFLALLGSSGSGKSTLLSMMAGLDRPTSGAIRVRDRNLAELDKDELARYRRETVGMVFQSFRSEEHTSELQSLRHLVCRLLLEKKKRHGGIINESGCKENDQEESVRK